MELRHLRYFIAAAEEEHFGRAADRLHITRPAVSQMIIDLESELGTELFERRAHSVKLTAAGQVLLPQLQSIMNDLANALATAKQVGEGKSGALNIGYGSLTLLHPLFRSVVKKLHETCPGVTISLFEIPTSQQMKALAEGRIHAGFMHFGPTIALSRKRNGQGILSQDAVVLDHLKIQSGGLGVAVPRDHRLAKRKSVSLVDLANEQFVVVPASSIGPGYGSLYTLCQKAGFEPKIVQEVNSVTTQLNLVSVGMGVGLIMAGKSFVYPSGCAVVPLNDVEYGTSFMLGWVQGQSNPTLSRLIDIVKAEIKHATASK
ncbi:LysR substrate-binding domain-containing protein [Burkholderia pseudomultivorans]|uniref:LysR family transcriptional regulator n=1 Tax=Burkholderia pseudomultivorans TaxID=1207504 RepID=A0A132ECU8_9BURK|nr:LysR substrate-binding domain-containing protein [Burkholderia pseudomultivorans]KWF24865.1 LysR family transcriptional regulator [Burkholderia pseudomultivorans]